MGGKKDGEDRVNGGHGLGDRNAEGENVAIIGEIIPTLDKQVPSDQTQNPIVSISLHGI